MANLNYVRCNYRLNIGGNFTFYKSTTSMDVPIRFYKDRKTLVYKYTLSSSKLEETFNITHQTAGTYFDYCTTYEIFENYLGGSIVINNEPLYYVATFTTPPARPTVAFKSASNNSATVEWGFEDNAISYYTKIVFELYSLNNLSTPVQTNVLNGSDYAILPKSGEIIFTDISPGSYVVKAQTIYTVNGTDIPCCYNAKPSDADNADFKAETDEFKVGAYNWTYSHIDANGNAIRGNSKTTSKGDKFLYITAEEWNGLCEYVRDVIGYWKCETAINSNNYGLSESTTYGQMLDMAKVVSGENISAVKFNYLRYVIGSTITSTGLTDYAKGNEIKPEYFNILVEKSNT